MVLDPLFQKALRQRWKQWHGANRHRRCWPREPAQRHVYCESQTLVAKPEVHFTLSALEEDSWEHTLDTQCVWGVQHDL